MIKLSILMSVYNAETYIEEALNSVLNAYSKDYELIIINDGSSDQSISIINRLKDDVSNFKLVNKSNTGLTNSLNVGLEHVRGKYIARLDADDICSSDRFIKQIQILDKHPDIYLVGCNSIIIDRNSKIIEKTAYGELSHYDCVSRLEHMESFFPHSSWMMRRECIDLIGGYDEFYLKSQDYDFMLRIIEKKKIYCLPEHLVLIRKDINSITFDLDCAQFKYSLIAFIKYLIRNHKNSNTLKDSDNQYIKKMLDKIIVKEKILNKVLAFQYLLYAKYMLNTKSYFEFLKYSYNAIKKYPLLLVRYGEVKNIRKNPMNIAISVINEMEIDTLR